MEKLVGSSLFLSGVILVDVRQIDRLGSELADPVLRWDIYDGEYDNKRILSQDERTQIDTNPAISTEPNHEEAAAFEIGYLQSFNTSISSLDSNSNRDAPKNEKDTQCQPSPAPSVEFLYSEEEPAET